jgi:hypothetical protein
MTLPLWFTHVVEKHIVYRKLSIKIILTQFLAYSMVINGINNKNEWRVCDDESVYNSRSTGSQFHIIT